MNIDAALEAMLDKRRSQYGLFANLAAVSQDLKEVLIGQDGWHRLSHDQREAMEMICHKMARIVNGDPNHLDSWEDLSGYATLISEKLKGYPR